MNESKSMAIIPRSVDEAARVAKIYSQSHLVPADLRGKEADVYLSITYGMELGIPPAASLRAVAIIKGKPSLYADAMVGLVLASGKAKYFRCVESNPDSATYETWRIGAPEPVRKTFDAAVAQTAGLTGGNHKSYPQHLKEARAKSWLARDVYPDLLHGIYSAEEAAEMPESIPLHSRFSAPPAPLEAIDAEVVGDEPSPETRLALELEQAIVDAGSPRELHDVAARISNTPDSVRDYLRPIYAKRSKELAT